MARFCCALCRCRKTVPHLVRLGIPKRPVVVWDWGSGSATSCMVARIFDNRPAYPFPGFMKSIPVALFLLILHLACGPSPEKLFDQSFQTDSGTERKKLREELLKRYPNHPYGVFAKAYLLGANGEKEHFIEQLDLYSQVIKMRPDLAAAYVNRGIIRENLKLQSDAVADYTKAIELNPNAHLAYLRRGILKSRMNDPNGALVDLGMAINLKPKDFSSYLARGRLHNSQKKYAEALSDLNVALGISQNDPNALFERGLVKHSLKDYQGAKADYLQIEDSQVSLKAAAEVNIALILMTLGAPRTEYCLHFGNAYQRDRKMAGAYYQTHCS